MPSKPISRRNAFAAAGAGSLALAGFAGGAAAAPLNAAEKANVQIVDAFMKAWTEASPDPVKIAAYLADDCVLRMEENKPAVTGKVAALEAIKKFLTPGTRFDIKTHETFAKGPLVANSRIDAAITQGKMSPSFDVAGAFIVKNGKIQEWADYLVPKA